MTIVFSLYNHLRAVAWLALVALVLPHGTALAADASDPSQDKAWHQSLRQSLFGDRPILEGDDVISIDTPVRAEDPSVVPVTINAGFAQTAERYIKHVTLLIDNNPAPIAGTFTFTPLSGRADLALRVRINAYTPVRAIAELNDGSLHMARRFVKASGGCSAPIGTDLEQALTRLGKMKLKIGLNDSASDSGAAEPLPASPVLSQLRISHPNVTGMQMDQLTRMYAPAHYINAISVSYAGQPVFSAKTDISISADPSFRFYFVPSTAGEMVAEVTDNTGQRFTRTFEVPAPAPAD